MTNPKPKRILIVRPSALGDVCRTVPILVSLRKAYPKATIDWLVQEDFADAITVHPALDEAVLFPRQRFARWWRNPAVARELYRWFAGLGKRGYDVVFDCQGLGRSGLITWATKAPSRVGLRTAREFAWVGYNVRHPPASATHTVEQMMGLLTAEGIEAVYDLTLHVSDADRAWWNDRRTEQDSAYKNYVVFAATSRWPSKRWPQLCWSGLIAPLLERGFQRVVLVGSPTEREQVREIVRQGRRGSEAVVDLVGSTTVGQTMAVIADAALVIGNDSAPLHMAVGLARPYLGLYGPTDPAIVGPYGDGGEVVRTYAPRPGESVNFKRRGLGDALMCMIRPADVLDRVDQIRAKRLIVHSKRGARVSDDRGDSKVTEGAAS